MQKLNLPTYPFKTKSSKKHTLIFDDIRKKHVVLTPEEWVRQHFIQFLISEKKYPASLISIEKQFFIYGLKKRSDILIFNTDGLPYIIVECKAPQTNITQKIFDQIARYNLALKATYLIVTNGLQHYFCKLNLEEQAYLFLDDIPSYR